MVKVKCVNGICGVTFEVEEDKVDKTQEYMQCPFCGEISPSPLYEGSGL